MKRFCAGCGEELPEFGRTISFFHFGDAPPDRCHDDPECIELRNLRRDLRVPVDRAKSQFKQEG
jgi:hypothetical protein